MLSTLLTYKIKNKKWKDQQQQKLEVMTSWRLWKVVFFLHMIVVLFTFHVGCSVWRCWNTWVSTPFIHSEYCLWWMSDCLWSSGMTISQNWSFIFTILPFRSPEQQNTSPATIYNHIRALWCDSIIYVALYCRSGVKKNSWSINCCIYNHPLWISYKEQVPWNFFCPVNIISILNNRIPGRLGWLLDIIYHSNDIWNVQRLLHQFCNLLRMILYIFQ